MITGIGTDFIEKKRIEKVFKKYGNRFLNKILSESEKKKFPSISKSKKISFLTSAFSSKESFVKALGTGFREIYPRDISIIKDKLGIKPPIMTPELEDKLCNLFMEIQRPYAKFCPDDRVNFLNYYYTVYKLCELLDETEFLPFFPMLKDREKRIEQDDIWKKICCELNWEFIPTI